MKTTLIHYKAPLSRAHAQFIPAIIFIPGGIVMILFMFFIIIPAKYNASKLDEVIILFILNILFIFGLKAFIDFALGFWRFTYFVDLTEEQVVGSNLWKQSKTIRYEDIIAIKRFKKYQVIEVLAKDGESIKLAGGIDFLGKCVETIRERAINVKKVDYGDLDKIPGLWEANEKYDEKKKKLEDKYWAGLKKTDKASLYENTEVAPRNYCPKCNRIEEDFETLGKCSNCDGELKSIT